MSSGLETNKIVGAVLTALLVTVGIGHFGAALFGSGGHGEQVLAYPVEGGEGAGPVEEAAPEIIPTVLPLLAEADPAKGEQLFAACRSCHTPEEGGNNGVGPNLWNVVGADIAAHEDFNYSDVLQAMEGEWSYDHLNFFIHSPREYAPGTRMTYPGMPPLEDRAAVIAYLRTLSDDPMPLPTQEEIDAAVAEQEAAMGAGEATQDADGDESAGPVEEAASEGGPGVLALLADADPAKGEQLFVACKACHTPNEGGANGVGPNLWNVVGSDIAAREGFNYSDALLAVEGAWTYDKLDLFFHNPREYVPSTRMTFPGMPPPEDRAAVIAYLRTLSDDPMPLPTQEEIDAAGAGQEATPREDNGEPPEAGGEGEDG